MYEAVRGLNRSQDKCEDRLTALEDGLNGADEDPARARAVDGRVGSVEERRGRPDDPAEIHGRDDQL